jgi:hypothetical protein
MTYLLKFQLVTCHIAHLDSAVIAFAHFKGIYLRSLSLIMSVLELVFLKFFAY